MRDKVILFCDHTIGYDLSHYLLSRSDVQILDIYTNERTENSWWKNIFELEELFGVKIKVFSPNDYKEIQQLSFDYLFLFSWKHLIPEEMLTVASKGVVNLHYSLLPRHRGVYPVNWAIIQGDDSTGITFHFVDKSIDGGNIIGQRSLPILSSDTVDLLLQKLDSLALKLFKEIWDINASWRHICEGQDNSKASYHSKNDFKKIEEIKVDQTIVLSDFINLIRGKSFNGGCQLSFKSERKNYFLNVSITPSSSS